MATTLTINGTGYSFPATGDENWGDNVSSWAAAVTGGMLQKAGGTFTLTAEVDFGATFGVKTAYIKSRATNPGSAGILRLGNAESIAWRNAANSADLALKANASNLLEFNGTALQSAISVTDTSTIDLTLTGAAISAAVIAGSLTNTHIAVGAAIAYSKLSLTGSIVNADVSASAAIAYSKLTLTGSIVNADVAVGAAIAYSKLNLATSIVNADISASAAIAYSKLALTGTIVNADISASAAIAYSKLNLTGTIVNADISASAAIAYSKLTLTGAIVNADVSASAAIAYSKLNLATSIVNADISTSAAIAYSKLNLTGNIVNADIGASAAIAFSKMAALTASRVLVSNVSGVVSVSSVTDTTLGFLDATSSVQTQLDAKVAKSTLTTKGDIYAATAASTPARVAVGTDGQVLTADSASSPGIKWATPASAPSSPLEMSNLALACSVGASALTIALKDSSGSNPSAGSPVKIGFRSGTVTNGTYNQRSVTGALSVVVPSGATLGHLSSAACWIYIYAIDNAGTVELAVSSIWRDESALFTSTTISAAADDSGLYSTTGRTGVPARLIGRLKYNASPDGTYSAIPDEVTTAFAALAGPVKEYKASTSSAFSGGTAGFVSGEYPLMTGNVITLTPGSWTLSGSFDLSNGGSSPAYTQSQVRWSTVNGDNTTTLPSGASLDAGIAFKTDNHASAASAVVNAQPVRVTVTTATTIYLNCKTTATTIANASLTAYLFAERVA
jgi:hypothetical protein